MYKGLSWTEMLQLFIISPGKKRGGKLRLKTYAFAGDPGYAGTTGYTESYDGDVNVYDVNPIDKTKDTVETTRYVHGVFNPGKADRSGIFVEEKTVLGVVYKRDVVWPSLWIYEPVVSTSGYKNPNLTYVAVNGPTNSTSMLDVTYKKTNGDWVEQ
jgi:hypothetical protein